MQTLNHMKKKEKLQNQNSALPAGTVPGTLHFIGEVKMMPTAVKLFRYNEHELYESDLATENHHIVFEHCKQEKVNWLDIEGLSDIALIEEVGRKFDLHNLLLEDVLNTTHRPKLEIFDNGKLLIAKMMTLNKEDMTINTEHVSFILAQNTLITFQEIEGDVFEPVRKRLRTASGKIRKKDTAYLLFCLLDAIIDTYMEMVEEIGDRLTLLEEHILAAPSENSVKEIYHFKRQMMLIRKVLVPLRDVIHEILRNKGGLINEDNELYFRDLYDNSLQVNETLDMYKEMVTGLEELAWASMSNKMNAVMKTLTIISTIFIPMTFLAGIYGMNFDTFPEIHWKYGYVSFWVMCFTIATSLLIYFRRQKWL